MPITTVLFDLDGTLLPMELEVFTKEYLKRISTKLAPIGYEPKSLVETIWHGITAMFKNNGEKTNEEVFWNTAVALQGEKILADKKYFNEFYRYEFDKIKSVCGYNEAAAETVRNLKKRGLRIVLATNPIFPAIATENRLRWTGLSPEEFDFYTTYENSRYCKPNPNYYTSILSALGLSPSECLMVGNDVTDDMIAATLGIKTFLLTDNLINENNDDISVYRHGGFNELNKYLSDLQRNQYND